MKSRNREINVFSLSMVDMISGAMGAFLIIMIILSQYYKSDPNNSKSIAELQQELERAERHLDKIQQYLRGDIDIEQLLYELEQARHQLRAAQSRMADLQDRLDRASSQIDRLNERVDELTKDNNRLASRMPYLIGTYFNCPDLDVDIYVQAVTTSEQGKSMPRFDPNQEQDRFFGGDLYIDDPVGPGADLWMTRDVVAGTELFLYVKLSNPPPSFPPCAANTTIYSSSFADVTLPQVTLTPEKKWQYLGKLTESANGKAPKFAEAAPDERQRIQ